MNNMAYNTNLMAKALTTRCKYNNYTPEQRVEIGKYVTENGPSELLRTRNSEQKGSRTDRKELRNWILKEGARTSRCQKEGKPVLLDQMLDKAVQDYITTMRVVEGVVYTAILMAAAEGTIAAWEWASLMQNGDHI